MGDVAAFRMRVTPRQREMLRIRLWVYADMLFDEIEEHGDAPVDPQGRWFVAELLPRCTWNLDSRWRRAMARAFDDLAGDMDAGALPYPRTIAEQLALGVAIGGAQTALADHDYDEEFEALPEYPGDHHWDRVIDELLADRDTDALSSPDPAEVEAYLTAVPIDMWFETFPGHVPRDPARGYRR